MRPPLLAITLTATAALTACSQDGGTGLYGYAEGDYVSVAPDTPGRIETAYFADGDTVAAGEVLFRLDAQTETAALAAADARIAAATSRFDDAAAGARSPEIEAARDQLDQARTALRDATDTLERTRELFTQGHVSQARLDTAQAAADTARARGAEMRQRLTLVQLPAREHQLLALQAEIAAAQADRDRAAETLARRAVQAPADARVFRQLRFAGEQAGPAQPVYSLLPDGAVYALLFIPESRLAATSVGDTYPVTCDSCAAGLTVRITSIGDAAEFTPPVIYSDNERARLVYRAEARFDGTPPPPGTPLRFDNAQ